MGGMLKKFGLVGAVGAALMLSACSSGSSGKTEMTFQIWDTAQRDGMQALIDAYVAEHPDVDIKLQVTSWDEYWTKMDAAAESNQLPDIFWMHTNEILKYADYGMLEDVTNLYDDVDPNYYTEHFSEIALNNARGSDGRIYGVPKDKDTVCLVYNKEMFDAAGVAYPDENWTWDNLVEASQQIYDATGKYGYMAYADEQLGYWNFVYQAGGQILTEDKTKGDFLNPGTKKGMEFYIGLQDYEWCPDQNYFAQTNPGTAFFSSQGAMYLEGNWNLLALLQNNPEMEGKWDVAVLPKCPDPFLGTEEGQRIQGESGVAIPAYEGLEDTWMQVFEGRLSVQKCVDMFEYGVQSVNNASRPNWKSEVSDILIKMYTKELTIDEGLQAMQEAVDEASAP